MKSITWRALAEYPEHPNGDEFVRYLTWKLEHSPLAAKRLAAVSADLSDTSGPTAI